MYYVDKTSLDGKRYTIEVATRDFAMVSIRGETGRVRHPKPGKKNVWMCEMFERGRKTVTVEYDPTIDKRFENWGVK